MFKKNESNILQIVIDNEDYIEIEDFIDGISGIKNEYNSYIKEKCGKEAINNRIYLKEVRKGSIILELIENVLESKGCLFSLTPILIEFGKILINNLNNCVNNNQDLENNDSKSINNFKKIFNFCSNNKGKFEISLIQNNKTVINNYYSSIDANAAQNNCNKYLEKMSNNFLFEKVEMELYQARNSNYSTLGMMGIIKEINTRAKPIKFADDSLKESIINKEENPFNFIFNVDINLIVKDKNKPYNISENIKEYEIIKINGVINKDDIKEDEFDY